MLTVIGVLKAKEGKEKDMEEALKRFVPLVAHEEGTLRYVLHRAKKDPTKFLFYERYKDKEALASHGSTSHVKELFATIGPFIEGKLSIEICEEIASIPAKG